MLDSLYIHNEFARLSNRSCWGNKKRIALFILNEAIEYMISIKFTIMDLHQNAPIQVKVKLNE